MTKRPNPDRPLLYLVGAAALSLGAAMVATCNPEDQFSTAGGLDLTELETDIDRTVTRLGGAIMGEIRDPEDELPGPDEHYLEYDPEPARGENVVSAVRDCVESSGYFDCSDSLYGSACTITGVDDGPVVTLNYLGTEYGGGVIVETIEPIMVRFTVSVEGPPMWAFRRDNLLEYEYEFNLSDDEETTDVLDEVCQDAVSAFGLPDVSLDAVCEESGFDEEQCDRYRAVRALENDSYREISTLSDELYDRLVREEDIEVKPMGGDSFYIEVGPCVGDMRGVVVDYHLYQMMMGEEDVPSPVVSDFGVICDYGGKKAYGGGSGEGIGFESDLVMEELFLTVEAADRWSEDYVFYE